MSVKKSKKRDDAPMPATGAGLIRFYSDADSPGIKFSPYWTVGIAVVFVVAILILNILQLNS